MSELRETLHQPPNPEDLRRVPPGNPTCARIRGLLRDFVDGDLGRAVGVEVEEHVHLCRVCAVELSRAEHERLMVCRAFAALGQGPSLSPGFSDRVVQRLMDESSIEVAREAAPAAAKPVDRRFRTSPAPSRGIRGRGIRAWLDARPHTLLVTGLLVLLCASIGFSWFMVADREPEHSARLVVTEADGAVGVGGRQLKSGDGLGDLQSLWVEAGGAARVEWHDVSSLRQPAATLDVRGGGMVRLQNGAPLLVNGRVGIVTNRPVEIPMGDHSSLRLGMGEYVIAAEMPSDWLNGSHQSPDGPFGEGLQVEIEVVKGADAEIKRPRVVGSAFVAAGQIGVYTGTSTVTYLPGSGGHAVAQGTVPERLAPGAGSPNQTNFQGIVLDHLGWPNAGASINLSFTSGGLQRYLTLVSEADGRFSETTDCSCDRLFAIVQAEPAPLRLDLGVTPPQAMPVIRLQSNVSLASALVLSHAEPLRGRVHDEHDVPRGNVRVLPCIVDELFGSVLPLMSGQDTTDVVGAFQIHRLPSHLPPHQHLAVLLLDSQLEPTFVPVPERGTEQLGTEWSVPLSLVARRLRTVDLRGLPDEVTVEILEEVPGLRGESAVVKRTAETDDDGRVDDFRVGSGRLWVRQGPANQFVRELLPASGGWYRPHGPTWLRADRFRPMVEVGGTDLEVVQSYRHKVLAATGSTGSGTGNGQTLFVLDSFSHAAADAQVFSLAASGPRGSVDMKFHGFTSPAGSFPLVGVQQGSHIFVLGSDGAAGRVTLVPGLPPVVQLSLVQTGSAVLAEHLRPTGNEAAEILALRFESLGPATAGMRPIAVRFACAATGWVFTGLPAGEYRTMIGQIEHQFVVPAGGFVPIE